MFHCTRDEGLRGGGDSVYVKSCFKSVNVFEACVNLPLFESLLIFFVMNDKNLRMLTIHRPLNSSCDDFLNTLSYVISNSKPDFFL